MGHYSDSREATRRTSELHRREELQEEIVNAVESVNTQTLEYINFLINNENDLSGFVNTLHGLVNLND